MSEFDAKIIIAYSKDLLGCNLGKQPFIFSISHKDPCKENIKNIPVDGMDALVDLIFEATAGCGYVYVGTANNDIFYPVPSSDLRKLRRSVSKIGDCIGSASFRFHYGF